MLRTSNNTRVTIYEDYGRIVGTDERVSPWSRLPLYDDDCSWFDGRGYNRKGSCLSNGHYRCIDCSHLSSKAPRFAYEDDPLQPKQAEALKHRLTVLEKAVKAQPELHGTTEKVADLESRVEILEDKVEEAIRALKQHLEEGKDESTSAGLLGALALLGAIRKPKSDGP